MDDPTFQIFVTPSWGAGDSSASQDPQHRDLPQVAQLEPPDTDVQETRSAADLADIHMAAAMNRMAPLQLPQPAPYSPSRPMSQDIPQINVSPEPETIAISASPPLPPPSTAVPHLEEPTTFDYVIPPAAEEAKTIPISLSSPDASKRDDRTSREIGTAFAPSDPLGLEYDSNSKMNELTSYSHVQADMLAAMEKQARGDRDFRMLSLDIMERAAKDLAEDHRRLSSVEGYLEIGRETLSDVNI